MEKAIEDAISQLPLLPESVAACLDQADVSAELATFRSTTACALQPLPGLTERFAQEQPLFLVQKRIVLQLIGACACHVSAAAPWFAESCAVPARAVLAHLAALSGSIVDQLLPQVGGGWG
jgi:hypothetical protein